MSGGYGSSIAMIGVLWVVAPGSTLRAGAARPAQAAAGASRPAVSIAEPLGASRQGVVGKPEFTGEPISVDLRAVDINDFFRLIHQVSGLNVVVDPSVTGTITLALDSVPWDQALDIVLKNNGLAKVLDGNVLRIAKTSTLEAEDEASAKLADARADAEPLVTVFRPLRYARAAENRAMTAGVGGVGGQTGGSGIVGILKNLPGVLSKRGSVVADPRDNAVIVTDVATQMPIIDSVIAKLDTKSKQISIEARIVLANSDFVRSLQSALNGGLTNRSGTTVTGGSTGVGASAQGNVPTNPPPPSRVTLGQTGALGFGAYAISNQTARYFINAAIAAAESRDQAKVISAPTIVTQNNTPGEVLQGVQIPIQTTINNTISTQFVNATLTLDVTPQVTEGGHIFLQLKVENNSPGAVLPGAGGPSINTQSATTEVMVADGGTVVFGGVKVSSRAKSVTQVPGLGNIPVFGHLFKSSNVQNNDQELLFFITPKLLPD